MTPLEAAALPGLGPGLRTDLLVQPPGTDVERAGDLLVVRTPERPDYRYGNMLVLLSPPDDLGAVDARWDEHLGRAGLTARMYAWETAPDVPPPDVVGREVDDVVLLVHEGACPLPPHPAAAVVDPADEAGWVAVTGLSQEEAPDERGRAFMAWRVAQWRVLAAAGLGAVWAVRDGDRALSTVGVFGDVAVRRCQNVVTTAAARRQGLAGGLLAAALADDDARPLHIAAEAGGDAERLYRRLGFRPVSRVPAVSVRLDAEARG